MADMSSGSTPVKRLSDEEIDDLVAAEADHDSAWEAPVTVKPATRTTFSLPRDLAARASFLARLHHLQRVEDWLAQVIRERIELEEVAFAAAKREISGGGTPKPRRAKS
jgi:hypothetical protein